MKQQKKKEGGLLPLRKLDSRERQLAGPNDNTSKEFIFFQKFILDEFFDNF